MIDKIKRGEIYMVDLDPVIGSEQGGIRPAVVLQNDVGNTHSPTIIIAPMTSKLKNLPTHVNVENILDLTSQVQLEQIRTIDKKRVFRYLGTLNDKQMERVDKAFKLSMDL